MGLEAALGFPCSAAGGSTAPARPQLQPASAPPPKFCMPEPAAKQPALSQRAPTGKVKAVGGNGSANRSSGPMLMPPPPLATPAAAAAALSGAVVPPRRPGCLGEPPQATPWITKKGGGGSCGSNSASAERVQQQPGCSLGGWPKPPSTVLATAPAKVTAGPTAGKAAAAVPPSSRRQQQVPPPRPSPPEEHVSLASHLLDTFVMSDGCSGNEQIPGRDPYSMNHHSGGGASGSSGAQQGGSNSVGHGADALGLDDEELAKEVAARMLRHRAKRLRRKI